MRKCLVFLESKTIILLNPTRTLSMSKFNIFLIANCSCGYFLIINGKVEQCLSKPCSNRENDLLKERKTLMYLADGNIGFEIHMKDTHLGAIARNIQIIDQMCAWQKKHAITSVGPIQRNN